jgi:membrane protein implicated in regulation of membrane protease activity
MPLPYKTRRRLSLLILVVGLPLYIAAALFTVSLFDRPPIWLEFIVYVVLGIVWALPFRSIFRGVGQADPDDQNAKHGE